METPKDLFQTLITELLERSLDVVYRYKVEPERGYAYISPAVEKLTGYTPEEHYRNPFLFRQYIHPDDLARLEEVAEKKGEGLTTFRAIHKDGSVRWIERNEIPVPDNKGHVVAYDGIIRDVTEKQTALEALKKSEERFRAGLEHALEGIALIDDRYKFEYVNGAFAAMIDYKPGELTGMDLRKVLADESRQLVSDRYKRRQKGEKVPQKYEFYMLTKNGEKRLIQISSTVFTDSQGKKKTVAQTLDITEQRKAEEEIRLQLAALESAANSIIITETTGKIKWVNKAFTRITGYARDEVLGENPRILKSGKHPTSFYKDLWENILAGKVWRGKIINRKKDGSFYSEDLSITPIINNKNKITHFVAIQIDITQQEAILQELQTALERLHHLSNHLNQRIENERKNTARNLHDNLGQLLTAIKMDISWLTRQLPQETKPGVIERIRETKSLVDQAIGTVQQITTELRPNILDELGLWDALESLCEEMSKRAGIVFEIEMPQGDIAVPEEFILPIYRVVQEAITNIIRHSEASRSILEITPNGNLVVFSLRDNGMGITEKQINAKHSFGLMGMRERIESLGGTFEIIPQKQGTEVLFTLPLSKPI